MSKTLHSSLLGAGLLLWCSHGMASSYSISPLMLVAAPTDKVLEFRVANTSNKVEPVQIQVKRWQQIDGKNHYTQTFDLLPTPATATLKPHQSQYFRLGVVIPNHSVNMKSYRLLIRQLPSKLVASNKKVAQPHSSSTKLQASMHVLLDVSIPVFLQPKVPLKERFTWHYQSLKDKQYRIQLTNQGNVVLKLTHLNIFSQNTRSLWDKNTLSYVLPSAKRQWVLTLDQPPKQIVARVNGQKISTDLAPLGA